MDNKREISTKITVLLITFLALIFTTGFTNPSNFKALEYGSISGTVLLSDGTPAVGATIGILEINKYASADHHGNYIITRVPFGEHKVQISTIEAEPKEFLVNLKTSKHKLNVTLEKSEALMLEHAVVTGKSQGQVIKDMGYSLNLVETKESMLTSLSSSELLDRTSGIKLRQSGGMGSNIDFNINGLSGNSVRVFIDGIPIKNYGSSFSLSSIPPSMIERIELYKGVVPAHLAEDALGGAVNIVMKQTSVNNLTAAYSYGSLNTHKADISGNYRHEKSGFTAGGSAFYNYTDNSYNVWGDPIYITDPLTGENKNITARRFHDNYESAGVNANIGFTRTKWADRFMIGLLSSAMKKDIQHGATMQVVYGNRKSSQTTQMANLQYAKRDIIEGLDVSGFASYSYGVRKIIDTTATMYNWLGEIVTRPDGEIVEWQKGGGEAGVATLERNLDQNIAGRLNIGYSFLPNHKISANWLYNNFTRDVEDPLLPQISQDFLDTRYLTKNIMGLSYDGNIIKDKLKFSLFYKRYMQTVKLSEPEIIDGVMTAVPIDRSATGDGFGGALSYVISPQVQLTFSGEKAIRLPDNNELLGNLADNVEAAYDLRPESSMNLNLGANLGPFIIAGDHVLSGDVNFFYRDIKDLIQKALTFTTDDMYGYENVGKVLSRGFDLDIRYAWRDMLFFTYSISNFNARFNLQYDEFGSEYVYYQDRLRNAPYLTMNSSLKYVKKDLFARGALFAIEYNFGYVHEFYRNWASLGGAGKAIIPTQLVQDIGVVYTFPKRHFSLSFDVKNIFDQQVFDNWALQKPGRMMFVKVSYNLF